MRLIDEARRKHEVYGLNRCLAKGPEPSTRIQPLQHGAPNLGQHANGGLLARFVAVTRVVFAGSHIVQGSLPGLGRGN
jgi:hypothetical protein